MTLISPISISPLNSRLIYFLSAIISFWISSRQKHWFSLLFPPNLLHPGLFHLHKFTTIQSSSDQNLGVIFIPPLPLQFTSILSISVWKAACGIHPESDHLSVSPHSLPSAYIQAIYNGSHTWPSLVSILSYIGSGLPYSAWSALQPQVGNKSQRKSRSQS